MEQNNNVRKSGMNEFTKHFYSFLKQLAKKIFHVIP